MKVLKAVLPHLTVILSLMFMVFLVLDQFNPLMNFVKNDISSVLLGILCLCGLTQAVITWKEKAK